jgi:hypothetical protein
VASSVRPPQNSSTSRSLLPTGTIRLDGRFTPGPAHGDHPLDQREAGLEDLGDAGDGAGVLHHDAHVHRQLAGGDLPRSRADQHLLRALRILHGEREHRDVEVGRDGGPQRLDGVRLVRSTPITARLTPRVCIITRTPKCTRSGNSTMVRWSVVRYGSHSAPLTSSRSIFTSLRRGELHVRREGRAAEPHHPAVLHRLHHLLRRQPLPVRDHAGPGDLRGVPLHADPHRLRHAPVRVRPPVRRRSPYPRRRRGSAPRRSRPPRRSCRRAPPGRPAGPAARRLPGVLPERQHDLLREGHPPDRQPAVSSLCSGGWTPWRKPAAELEQVQHGCR